MPELQSRVRISANGVHGTLKGSLALAEHVIGLVGQKRIGRKPFQLGFVAATDTPRAIPQMWAKKNSGMRDAIPTAYMSAMGQRNGNGLTHPGGP